MKTNFTFSFILILFLSISGIEKVNSQSIIDTIAIQDFEISPQAPIWSYSGTPNLMSGYTTASASPASSPIGINGSMAWETSSASAGVILEFSNITIPTIYDSIFIGFRLAAMCLSSSTGGPDNLDYVEVYYSLDNGITYVNRLTIKGSTANNSTWPYSATGVAVVYYSPTTNAVFNPTTTGLQTTMGYSNCGITFPGNITQVKLKIKVRSSSATDNWLIDNVIITGKKTCSNTTSNVAIIACDSQISQSGNQIWTASGTYTDTIPNTTGCDSIMTVQLTINHSTTSTISKTSCFNYTSPSGKYLWSLSGTYNDTILNTNGCDSILTINLTIDTVNNNISYAGGTLTAQAQGAAYQWLDCNNAFNAIAGANSQNFIPIANGNYSVQITENNCIDTSICMNINDVSLSELNNEFELIISTTSANGLLNIGLNKLCKEVRIKVFSIDGRIVKTDHLLNVKNFQMELPSEAGIYLVEINNGEVNKIVKIYIQ